ncbi:CpaD family pilus assembly lipoprotein [Bradyrhizobium pachyrhizi]|uniref:CpaD family pilus assembly lipoprotein n=1 Tax=Bradyrhizobium TaxID=374 RepID=UPI0024B1E932|nr:MULTISPECIES: CpaD family pilus assembly lipoprotein [Bradyrhizobium]WFU54879.1 CpaD family pilus assembly lipoprotein [Bradyrhizobium pachyrhizi]WOH80671.1 CpaD family pilus assembly lipoprotein [Bradyrhizobium sp. BEA-2-5]
MTPRIVGPLIALTASLGGCTSTGPTYLEPAAQAVLVQKERNVLLLQSLRGSERRRLWDFIARTSRGRRDALHLDIAASPRLGAQIAHEARAMGVDAYNIRLYGPSIDRRDGFAARIEATTYEAHPPVCPSMSIVGPSVNDNSFDPTLGCSIRNNLAIMVNDPHDLLDNQVVMPSDGNRAAIPVATYKIFATGNNSNLGTPSNKASADPTSAGTQAVQPSR